MTNKAYLTGVLGDEKLIRERIFKNNLSGVIIASVSFMVVIPLFFILFYLLVNGVSSISLGFITNLPKPVGETGGGIINAIVGSVIIVILALVLSVPVAILGGVYISEYPDSRLSYFIRLSNDILQGTPSIVIGIFAWVIAVVSVGHFSAFSGSIALGIMVIPIILKSTEETLKRIPRELREAAVAMGVPYHRVIIKVVIPTGLKGIVNGVLLSSTRISGETAPLLFTAFGSPFMNLDIGKPMSSLPLVIYTYATSPYDEWHKLAWGASLLLILVVFGINMLARIFVSKKEVDNGKKNRQKRKDR